MPTQTPNYGLWLYNSTTDEAEFFLDYRLNQSGPASGSNMNRIDTALAGIQSQVTTLAGNKGVVPVSATFISANYYEATVSGFTSYITDVMIAVRLDTSSTGTVTLNINSLGTKSLMKYNSNGSLVNLDDGDMLVNRDYLFRYNGTSWIWVEQTVFLTGGPQGFVDNYSLITSVASNNLTVTLKTQDGSVPSSSNPIRVRIGNTSYIISSSISVTKNAGTNWCNSGSAELKTKEIDYFVYLIYETGGSAGVKIGFSRIPYGRVMGDFVNTTTSEKYIAGNWTNFNSSDLVEVIGRFNAINSGSASYNWSIPSTSIVLNKSIRNTRPLSWTPTTSTAGSLTYTSVTFPRVEYMIYDNLLFFELRFSGTLGGTGNPYIYSTIPFTPIDTSNSQTMGISLSYETMASPPTGFAGAYYDVSLLKFVFIKYNSSNWLTSGVGTIDTSGRYRV